MSPNISLPTPDKLAALMLQSETDLYHNWLVALKERMLQLKLNGTIAQDDLKNSDRAVWNLPNPSLIRILNRLETAFSELNYDFEFKFAVSGDKFSLLYNIEIPEDYLPYQDTETDSSSASSSS